MKWIEARVLFSSPTPTLTAELIAEIFSELGLAGSVIQDGERDPTQDWADDAPAISGETAVVGYFPESGTVGRQLDRLNAELSNLKAHHPMHWEIETSTMATRDWAENWKKFFKPQKISGIFVIKPTWRSYTPQTDTETIIEIDPGMAFGTGTHPTTTLCLTLLEEYLQAGDDLLDVGTGSGILLIAAAKLGASRGVGLDNDSDAVAVARANLIQNRVADARFEVVQSDLVRGINHRFDLVVANIIPKVLLPLASDLHSVQKTGGLFICSGIPEAEATLVADKLLSCGYSRPDMRHREGWTAMAARFENKSVGFAKVKPAV